jgi:hypothetical protein
LGHLNTYPKKKFNNADTLGVAPEGPFPWLCPLSKKVCAFCGCFQPQKAQTFFERTATI